MGLGWGEDGQTGSGGMGLFGIALKAGPELLPLVPRIKATIETVERYMEDPAVKRLIAAAKDAIAEVEKISADPAVKDGLETAKEVMAVIAKAQKA